MLPANLKGITAVESMYALSSRQILPFCGHAVMGEST